MKYILAQFFFQDLSQIWWSLNGIYFEIIDRLSTFLLYRGFESCPHSMMFSQSVWLGVFPCRLGVCCHYFSITPSNLNFYAAIFFIFYVFIFIIRMKCYGNVGLSNTAASMHQSHHEPTESIELADNLFFPFLLTYLI